MKLIHSILLHSYSDNGSVGWVRNVRKRINPHFNKWNKMSINTKCVISVSGLFL